jgi:hypothetical protein
MLSITPQVVMIEDSLIAGPEGEGNLAEQVGPIV